jgi:hypothetical protein
MAAQLVASRVALRSTELVSFLVSYYYLMTFLSKIKWDYILFIGFEASER